MKAEMPREFNWKFRRVERETKKGTAVNNDK